LELGDHPGPAGELHWLEPGEQRQYDLEIGALAGVGAIDSFAARVSRLAPAHDPANHRR